MNEIMIAVAACLFFPHTRELSKSVLYRIGMSLFAAVLVEMVMSTALAQLRQSLWGIPLVPIVLVLIVGMVGYRIWLHRHQSRQFRPY